MAFEGQGTVDIAVSYFLWKVTWKTFSFPCHIWLSFPDAELPNVTDTFTYRSFNVSRQALRIMHIHWDIGWY